MVNTNKDKRIIDLQTQLDSEKDTFKGKLSASDSKYRESDQKRNAEMFEFEKEKAKLGLQFDLL